MAHTCLACHHWNQAGVFSDCRVAGAVIRHHGLFNFYEFTDKPEKENFCLSYEASASAPDTEIIIEEPHE